MSDGTARMTSFAVDPRTLALDAAPLDGSQILEGDPEVLEMILEAGARTTWRVHETLRKVFDVGVPGTDAD